MNEDRLASSEVIDLIQRLYTVVDELEELFPGRHFTPDGHLVGSLGEVIAAETFGLELLPASTKGHDATKDDLLVEIKATQGSRISFRGEEPTADHLIALQIDPTEGSFRIIYNGPASPAWDSAGPVTSIGARTISTSRLTELMSEVPEAHQLPRAT